MKLPDLEAAILSLDKLPEMIVLNDYSVVSDVQRFFDSHIYILKSHPGKPRFLPFYKRLLMVYEMIRDNDNNVVW